MKNDKVTRNKNLKTITVNHAFIKQAFDVKTFEPCPDHNIIIPCKIIAPYKAWFEMQKVVEDAFIENKPVSFRTIEPYIKTPAQALKEFYKQAPDEFTRHFYHFFIREANLINPLNKRAVKERGGNVHKLTWLQMHLVRVTARHLYIFLSYWLLQDKKKYPEAVKAFFKAHGIKSDALSETMLIITERFELDENKIQDNKTFYDKYIAYRELDTLRKAYQSINYLPIREPLKSL